MPIAFVDEDLIKAFKSLDNSDNQNQISAFPEHSFEASCLKVGISLNDLKERTYVSIMKVLFSFIDKRTTNHEIHKATQDDIDRLMS